MLLGRIALALVGFVALVSVSINVVRTLLVPRGYISGESKIAYRLVTFVFRIIGRWIKDYQRRDRLLAYEGAGILLAILGTWVVSYLASFTLLLLPSINSPFGAFREAGGSMLTLGFVSTSSVWATLVDFLAGGVGLVVITIQIAYLPTLYSAYNRRETEVTLLSSRAGEPPWGPELLARSHLSGLIDDLPSFYRVWERWAADVQESHVSYPVLTRFRSPQHSTSWVVALLAVCDSAALYDSVSPNLCPIESRLALRSGFLCFRHLSKNMGNEVDEDPSPNDPVDLRFEDFLYGYRRLAEVGFPLERGAEEAWPHFKGWRVNYEKSANWLAEVLDVVPAEWAGRRRGGDFPIGFVFLKDRTPEDPDADQGVPFTPTPRDVE